MTTMSELAIRRAYGDATESDTAGAFKAAVKALDVQRADFLTVAKVEGYANRAAFSNAEADKYRVKATDMSARGKDGAASRHLRVVERNERIRDEHLDKITAAVAARPDIFLVEIPGGAA